MIFKEMEMNDRFYLVTFPILPLLNSNKPLNKVKQMANKLQFGETVEGYNIPVLNEREIRASAGILFLFTFIALMLIIFKQNFVFIKFTITYFMIDFFIRVLVSPRFSPTLILGRLIVSRQNPEYVGAPQKKFAWVIGIILATTMFVLMVLLNSYSIISGLICLICLLFLFFESAFGICLGCITYKWIKKEKAQYCPGEVCDLKNKQDIQKTNLVQVLILLAFIGLVVAGVVLFSETLQETPHALFGADMQPEH